MPNNQLTIGDVLAASGGRLLGLGSTGLPLSGVTHDSRELGPGELFVAVRGPQHDGHDFVADAFARGAAAALVERIPADVVAGEDEGPPLVLVPSALAALRALAADWRERQSAEVVAVTGSVGRATTVELCAAVLRQRYAVGCASVTARAEVSLPRALLGLRPRVGRLIVEAAPADEGQVAALAELARPCATVVTSLQAIHLEGEVAVEERARRLGSLLTALPDGATAALNADEERVRALETPERVRMISFGLGFDAGVRAESVVGHGIHGTSFDLVADRQRVHVRLPLLGLFAARGALAAAAVGLAAGLEPREIGAGLQTASREPRIIAATGLNGSRVVDESSNASPESGLASLNMLAGLGGRRRIAVLGDMLGLGRQEVDGHRKVGNRAASVVNALVTVGDRARLIADEARRMGLPTGYVFEANSTDEAVEYLRHRLQPGDLVLVKGSPEMQLERIVKAIRVEG